jgi:aldehyde oxidoreductase
MPYTEYPYKVRLDTVRPYYEKAKARAEKGRKEGQLTGVGIAVGGYNVTGGPNDHAEVAIELNPDGTITHWNSWEDQGQGADVGTLVLTHEALRPLGIDWQDIHLIQNDTGQCPITGPAGANRSHYMAGNATIDGANKLMDAMRKADGTFRTYDEMVKEGIPTKYLGVHDTTDLTKALDPNTGVGDPTPEYNYVVFLSEVEVDPGTCKPKVTSMKVVYDIGQVGSVQAVEGQAYGALTHSIGFALSEEYIDDADHNSIIKCGFLYANDITDDMEVISCPSGRKTAPFGSVGCCEGLQSAGHVAVMNAIFNATGVRVYDMPARPEKIKAGMEALKAGKELKPDPYYLVPDLFEVLDDIAENPVVTVDAAIAL